MVQSWSYIYTNEMWKECTNTEVYSEVGHILCLTGKRLRLNIFAYLLILSFKRRRRNRCNFKDINNINLTFFVEKLFIIVTAGTAWTKGQWPHEPTVDSKHRHAPIFTECRCYGLTSDRVNWWLSARRVHGCRGDGNRWKALNYWTFKTVYIRLVLFLF